MLYESCPESRSQLVALLMYRREIKSVECGPSEVDQASAMDCVKLTVLETYDDPHVLSRVINTNGFVNTRR